MYFLKTFWAVLKKIDKSAINYNLKDRELVNVRI